MPRRKLQKGNYEDKYGRQYQNFEVNRKDVFQIERYYRWNKFISQFEKDNTPIKEYVQIRSLTISVRFSFTSR